MSFLAHDQVWSRDDWLTISLGPPLVGLLAWVLLVAIVYVADRESARETALFAAVFLGICVIAAMSIVWVLAVIVWAVGSL